MVLLITLLCIVSVMLALFSLILIMGQKTKLIFGIYPSKGILYHLKYLLAKLAVNYLRKKLYGKQQPAPELLDKPQTFAASPHSYDYVSFMASNAAGQKLLISMERRRKGVLKACLYLWLPEYGLLCSPQLPDMLHFTNDGSTDNAEFHGSGYHIYAKQAMREWRICYEGSLQQVSQNAQLQVKLQLNFEAITEHYFNYNKDLSAAVIADSIAREAWNNEFYKMIRNVKSVLDTRTHYEQSGRLQGELQIAGKASVPLQLQGFRDHSFGTQRALSSINRYTYFALFLNDGSSMIIGNLSQPSFFLSSLKVGYVCSAKGAYQPITSTNFELYSYGERGTPPNHTNFIVKTSDAQYFVQIKCEESAVRYAGGDWESKIFNQFIACTVNGVQGHGIAEYLYRHKGGRPASFSEKDAVWYQRIKQFERSLSNGAPLTAASAQDAEEDNEFGF